MARQRRIKPEFWSSRTISERSLMARLLFIATWNYADDEGRMQWDERLLRAFAFPMDDFSLKQVKSAMTELVDAGLIVEYSHDANGYKYAYIKNFHEHQTINRPQESALPKPSFSERSVNVHPQISDDSLPKLSEDKLREVKLSEVSDSSFDVFWNLYDKKIDPKKCRLIWAKLTTSEREEILDHVPKYVASTPDKQYRKHPTTYLNNRSWENEIIEPPHANTAQRNTGRHIPADELIANEINRRKQLGLDDDGEHTETPQSSQTLALGSGNETGNAEGSESPSARIGNLEIGIGGLPVQPVASQIS